MKLQVTDTVFDCLNATNIAVATEAMPDDLVFDTILLSYEGEGGRPGLIELCIGRGCDG